MKVHGEMLEDIEFDLRDVKRFSGGNKKAMAVILHSFINENKRNLETLEVSLANNDYSTIAALAHKMLTSYGHLGVNNIKRRIAQTRKTWRNP
jgi:HPt (histidine-containing phosphotransfer) domain-containing protein